MQITFVTRCKYYFYMMHALLEIFDMKMTHCDVVVYDELFQRGRAAIAHLKCLIIVCHCISIICIFEALVTQIFEVFVWLIHCSFVFSNGTENQELDKHGYTPFLGSL